MSLYKPLHLITFLDKYFDKFHKQNTRMQYALLAAIINPAQYIGCHIKLQ